MVKRWWLEVLYGGNIKTTHEISSSSYDWLVKKDSNSRYSNIISNIVIDTPKGKLFVSLEKALEIHAYESTSNPLEDNDHYDNELN